MSPASPGGSRRRRRLLLLLALACFWASSAGCVRRRMTIRTNPPGALVYIDDQQIGVTPVSTNFTYYGIRKLQLVKDGFETVTVKRNFRAPWYEIFPLDFFAENVWPREVRDERVVDVQLAPQPIPSMTKLRERAEGLRSNARRGFAAPLAFSPGAIAAPAVPPQAAPPGGAPTGAASPGWENRGF